MLPLQLLSPPQSFPLLQPIGQNASPSCTKWRYKCFATSTAGTPKSDQRALRKTNYYQKNIWVPEFIQSLKSDVKLKEKISKCDQIEKLREDVTELLIDEKSMQLVDKLELIDALQRLGVGYLFENEIKGLLQSISANYMDADASVADDLHATALFFRLLRQHCYNVSQGVFNCFKDGKGNFKEELSKDVKGMLSLYEASYLGFEGEDTMSEAMTFAEKKLKLVNYEDIEPSLAEEVKHALDMPLHWRMPRLESRWYIELCQRTKKINPYLLEIAKLDFNMLQVAHQEELTHMSRWWENLGVAKKLSFARERLVESFLWSVGLAYEPGYKHCRERMTKVVKCILIFDDVYDIHGSNDDLEVFTASLERWDTKDMDRLPEDLMIYFLALYNTTNEMVYITLREQNDNILPHLSKVWADLGKSMLMEAKWSKSRTTLTLEEYMANAWVSSSTLVVAVNACFAANQLTKENAAVLLKCLEETSSDLFYQSSIIFRLSNDIVTSSAELARGDVASAIQCYMQETNVSEEVARQKIRGLIIEAWKKLNKSVCNSPFPHSFNNMVLNHVRTGHSFYHKGDGIGVQDHYDSKERVMALLVEPIAPDS